MPVCRFDRVLGLRSLLNPVADASVKRVHGKTHRIYKARSAKNQAATSHYNWKSIEVQCRARTETEGRGKIVQFASKEDMIQFLTAHQQTCSTTILDKCLASPDRTATDDWSWADFKAVAMQCQNLTTKTNESNQADTTSEWCNEIWKRWQKNEPPLVQPTKYSDAPYYSRWPSKCSPTSVQFLSYAFTNGCDLLAFTIFVAHAFVVLRSQPQAPFGCLSLTCAAASASQRSHLRQ